MWDPIKNSGVDFFVGKDINTIHDVKDVLWRFSQSFRTILTTDLHTVHSDTNYVTIHHHTSGPLLWGGYSVSAQFYTAWYKVRLSKAGEAGLLWVGFWLLHLSPERYVDTHFHIASMLHCFYILVGSNSSSKTCTILCCLLWISLFLLQEAY
jgi:hypothetical protein